MRYVIFLIVTTTAFSACSVSLSKKTKQDDETVEFLIRNKDKLKQAVAFAIAHTWDSRTERFEVKSIDDPKNRRLLSNFGSEVIVRYQAGDENYDSSVTFKRIDFSGVHEVIYYFAINPVARGDYSEHDNAVRRVSENICYCRRPFPFM